MRCLIIEDYAPLRTNIEECLAEHGIEVDSAEDGEQGLRLAKGGTYDCIVLDLMLPQLDGIAILRRLRLVQNLTPILIVSARDSVEQRIEGLDAGADDYLTKPFELNELLARVRAVIRRSNSQDSPELIVGDLAIDLAAKKVKRRGEEIALTRREYQLLEYLALRAGRVVRRSEIWDRVYENPSEMSANAIEVYIGYLRKKLNAGGLPDLIQTRRGRGYCIQADGK